jgi:tetratricopeptide (TPR) repeat protein
MITPSTRFRFWLRAALFLLLATSTAAPLTPPTQALAAPGSIASAQASSFPSSSSIVHRLSSIPHSTLAAETTRTTDYFIIYYPQGEEKTADWYAGFIDEVNRAVSELLGAEPVSGMTLRIYTTEPDYFRANPMAEIHPGILAHAIPEIKEIGVAVERLRQQPPAFARESFRHEITHIVAGSLSNQRLPIGFHEGLAQYDELSSTRAGEVVQGLQEAQAAGKPLLSWSDLNDVNKFRQNIAVAYPQSYSVMAFLADRYGMEPFTHFLSGLRDSLEYKHALLVAYGKTMEALEKEWIEYLPTFLQEGWKHNILKAHDLDYGLALMGVGQFAEAEEHFTQAQRLYTDLGRNDRASQAAAYLANATRAKEAGVASTRARKELEAHNYAKAQQDAASASRAFDELSLPDYKQHVNDISHLAQNGLNAITIMDKARASASNFDFNSARASATEAGQLFAALGDSERVREANALLSDLAAWQHYLGLGVAGTGVLLLAGVAGGGWRAAMRARKRKAHGTDLAALPLLREENQSWL